MRYDDLISALDNRVRKGLVSVRERGPLCIYNYTKNCTEEGAWDDITKKSRGLIIDRDRKLIVGHGISKFFNTDEPKGPKIDELLSFGSAEVTDKLDGSIGILYPDPLTSEWRIATRGSFESDQALWATWFLNEKHPNLAQHGHRLSLNFEIIYPQNRIIVDYGGREELCLIAAVNCMTGRSVPRKELEQIAVEVNVPIVPSRSLTILEALDLVKNPVGSATESEGWVFFWPEHNLRVKFKRSNYMKLSRILSRLSMRAVFEAVRDGHYDELVFDVPKSLREIPDAARNNAVGVKDSVEAEFEDALSKFHAAGPFADRKSAAEFAISNLKPYMHYCFADLSGNDRDKFDIIWKRTHAVLKESGFFNKNIMADEITP